jgi:nucleoside-diphosphate-sugar epimerase
MLYGIRITAYRENVMKLVIFAATGGIGRSLVDQALAAGHEVTAAVRNPSNLPAGVSGVQVDLSAPDPAAIESAVAGNDAVLSALGPRSRAEIGIAAPGTRAIISAMHATGVRRIVVVSAAPTSTVAVPRRPDPPRHDPGDGFVMRHVLSPMIVRLLRPHYVDLAEMEMDLHESGLEWTVVRPPRLNDKPFTARYRSAYGRNIRGGFAIPRADVAHLMLSTLDEPESIGQYIGVAS